MADIAKFIDEIKNMTVVELNELVKALEEEFGRKRRRSRCRCGCSRCSCRCGSGREDRVQRRSQRHRREEDRRHQGCPRVHLFGSCRGESARRSARHHQRRRQQGRGGKDRCPHERSRRDRRCGIILKTSIKKSQTPEEISPGVCFRVSRVIKR